MRILPVFAYTSKLNSKSMAQGFQSGCRKPSPCYSSNSRQDIFIKLAQASMNDVKIESELKSMGLI